MTIKYLIKRLIEILKLPFYSFWCHYGVRVVEPNSIIHLDVVITAVAKDLDTLHLCVDGIRKNLKHVIEDIYIVSPNDDRIIKFALERNLIFVDERTILGYLPKDINYITNNGLNRSGWIFQQLIKLSGKIGNNRFFIVIDSDHILIKPHTFISFDNKMVFYKSTEFNYSYYKMNKRLINSNKIPFFSYVAHKMIFDKIELELLRKRIELEQKGNRSWDEIIIDNLDVNEPSCFSEFELYGSFVNENNKIQLPWNQKILKRSSIAKIDELEKKYSKYWSLTFPSYLN